MTGFILDASVAAKWILPPALEPFSAQADHILQEYLVGRNKQSAVHGCLANGRPAAARFLADLGAPLDPESAAALGRLDVLRSYIGDDSEVNRKRLDSAFLYACGYGSVNAAQLLLDRGIDPNTSDGEGQSGLHWACWAPHPAIVNLLLERGAAVDAEERRFHATPLDTVLWTWSKATNEDDRDRCYEAASGASGRQLGPEPLAEPWRVRLRHARKNRL